MRQVTHYICEYCNTQYSTEVAARDCERSHSLPKKDSIKYNYIWPFKSYPASISITFDDNKTFEYHL